MTDVETDAKIIQQAHKRGRMVVFAALAAGIGIAVLLMGWFWQPPAALVEAVSVRSQEDGGVPRPRQGLILTDENRGRVLFGRSCDSCHPGGGAGGGERGGVDLLNPEFRRDFKTEADIIQLIRNGTCEMPAFSRFVLADDVVAQIAQYVLARAKAHPSAASKSPLPALDGPGIIKYKCTDCHNAIDKPFDARDVQVLFALDEMSKCGGLTSEQKNVLRTYLQSQQAR